MDKKIISGSFWLSFGSIFSRILGVVYLIPWLAMIGSPQHQTVAQALFNTAYTPYALFIALGTAGFPSAIARRVAFFNGEDSFINSKHIAYAGFGFMLVSGVICGALLYGLAPILAANSPVSSVANATFAIRCLVPAIVILPSMSILRGWFQGNGDLKPFGISQLWEQFIRIIVILGGTYWLIEISHQGYVQAVFVSVAAAFVGAVASYLYLLGHLWRQRGVYRQMTAKSQTGKQHAAGKLLRMIGYESIPFVIVGSGITLSQLIDQLFFKQIMQGLLHQSAEATQYVFTIFSANPNKITTVIVSLAMAVAETSLPLLAGKLADIKKNRQEIGALLTNNVQLLTFVLLPLVVLVSTFAYPIYGIFFNFDGAGATYLVANVWQSLILALALDLLTVLQALRMSKKATTYLLTGLGIKLVLQLPLVYLFQGYGALLTTGIAFGWITIVSWRLIRRSYAVALGGIRPIIRLNLVFAVLATILVDGCQWLFGSVFFTGKLLTMGYAAVLGLIAVGLYVWLANRLGVAQLIFKRPLKLEIRR
ncbi:oligosaccharide flippase family protein [Levilactobacillus parabrevis]|uniref:Polysaccharide transporter n=1 Tax=Levilactobacillus parabrevis ATCC 53295 TaxID=1267003 RepID=A0A0R1GZV8_9LACO|nr:oligosaccharide flippase family protein [Levilactobacillus parabrevis]KRK39544.1 polysaccharide transporter [Levilactobacillus parabrevis ATCC 53295]KRO06890.1 polysaccharide transporter [Levilactobacillus parabrevis]